MKNSSDETVSDLDTSEKLSRISNTDKIAKKAYIIVALGLGGFLAWAALAPLDQGVPSMGMVSVDTKRKAIQHLQGGIVEDVFVREGAFVKEGDPLIRLNDSTLKADYQSVRQQFFSLKVIESRLKADQRGIGEIEFDKELVHAAKADPKLQRQMANESQLLKNKRASVRAQLASLKESEELYKEQVRSSSGILMNIQRQRESFANELVGVKKLVQEGYAPYSQQVNLERTILSLDTQLEENQAKLRQAQQAIFELRQLEVRTLADNQKEIELQLSQLWPQLLALEERFSAVSESLKRAILFSPVDGQVVGLQAQTVGGVVGPGEKIMDIVPEDELLLVEAQIQPSLIDRIKVGDVADLRFSSFAGTPQLVVPGVLRSLSADVIRDPNGRSAPYYLARIEVTPEGLAMLGSRKLQPGMNVLAVVKTGQRTFLDYLLHPLTMRLASSMKEE